MADALNPKPNSSIGPAKTISIQPNPGEMIKAAELIDITGTDTLSLAARRLFNQLIAHAHGPNMTHQGYRWTIPLVELRGSHNSNDRLQESLLAIMRVVVTVHHPDGRKTSNVRLLGDNEIDHRAGTLTYELSEKLIKLMRDSTIFGKLEIRTMMAFHQQICPRAL